jgi:hypothetical protein
MIKANYFSVLDAINGLWKQNFISLHLRAYAVPLGNKSTFEITTWHSTVLEEFHKLYHEVSEELDSDDQQ